jgi:restriction system protein
MKVIQENNSVAPSGVDEITFIVRLCRMCGWWTKQKFVISYLGDWDTSTYSSGAIGSLYNLDVSDQSIPIEEIRSYLAVKYDERFNIDPWRFEEVVASVYKDLGYYARVTARSGDGGIDVVLDGSNSKVIGVQVKRYKDKIKVEQIRSFVGALYLKRMTRGIFVTTSSFQSGADNVAQLSSSRGIPIELVDAQRFYQALGIAQQKYYKTIKDPLAPFVNVPLGSLGFGY